MMTVAIESDHAMYLSAFNMRSDWFFLVLVTDKDQQESRAAAGKPHVRCRCKIRYVSKFAAASRGFPPIARLSCLLCPIAVECVDGLISKHAGSLIKRHSY